MRTVAIYNIAKENINYTGLLVTLEFEVITLKEFSDVMKHKELDVLFCDGNFFVDLDKKIKKELRKKFKNLKIILTGEFSDSYLFSKVQNEDVEDFIVVPFGYKECLNLLERQGFSYSSEVLKHESFEE